MAQKVELTVTINKGLPLVGLFGTEEVYVEIDNQTYKVTGLVWYPDRVTIQAVSV